MSTRQPPGREPKTPPPIATQERHDPEWPWRTVAGLLAIGVFVAGAALIVAGCLNAADWFEEQSWGMLFFIPAGWLMTVGGAYHCFEIRDLYNRLVSEYEIAFNRYLPNQTFDQLAKNQYRELLARAEEIQTKHEERLADQRWINYLKHKAGAAGQVVLKYYHQEVDLLRQAQATHAKMTPEAAKQARGMEKTKYKAKKMGTMHLAKTDIMIEAERRKKERKSGNRWWPKPETPDEQEEEK